MIGKVVKPGKGFRGLINYLLKGPKDADPATDPDKRVAWIAMRNMLIEDPDLVPALMRATAAKSKRVQAPVYHYVISWHQDEAPSDDIMRQVADTTCADLDLSDYQALYVAHNDTSHRHVHIVVNRVHPETGVAWRTSQDYQRIELSLRRQSEAHGFTPVPGKHADPDKTRLSRRPKTPEYQKAKKDRQTPRLHWSPDLLARRRDVLTAILDTASSWQDLHAQLALLGLSLERKGQGLVFVDGHGDLKLSALGKSYRVKNLQERYQGPFQASPDMSPGRSATVASDAETPASERHLPDHAPRDRASSPQVPKKKARPYRGRQVPPNPKADAIWADLAEASATTDFALILYRLGLANRAQLKRAFDEQSRAQDAVDSAKPILEQLLKPAPKPEPAKAQPEAPRPDRSSPPDRLPPRPRKGRSRSR